MIEILALAVVGLWLFTRIGGGSALAALRGSGGKYTVLGVLGSLVRSVVGLAYAASTGWVRDLPRQVDPDPGLESVGERRAQAISALAWPLAAVWLTRSGYYLPAVPVTAMACLVFARRVMASRGYGWPIQRLLRDASFWARRSVIVATTLVLLGMVYPLWLALAYDGERPLAYVVTAVAWIGSAAAVGWLEANWRRRVSRLSGTLAAAHGVLVKVLDEAVLRPGAGRGFFMTRIPPAVITRLDQIESGVAEQMPAYEVQVLRHLVTGAVTSIAYRPASEETLRRREVMAQTSGLVVSLDPVADPAPWRPDEHVALLAREVSATRGGQVDAALAPLGFRVVEWQPERHQATVARLRPRTVELRNSLLRELGLREPWDLEIGVNAVEGQAHVVTVYRSPGMISAEKRREAWAAAARLLLPSEPGERWRVEDDPTTRRVTLIREADPLRDTQPYPWDSTPSLTAIPFGMGEDGQPLSLGLLEVNQLLGGTPGSGKSGGLTALLCGIARLEHVALIGLDPKRVEQKPWLPRFSRIGKTEDNATDILERMVTEMDRRYDWLEQGGKKKFTPALFSDRWPLLVLMIDELADLVSVAVEKEEKAAEVGRSTMIRRLIAKGRAAGIVVVAATQKPQSDVVPTALRDMIQLRIAYATTNAAMTDTILGAGMAANGGAAHDLSASQRGVCYVVSETSRTPVRVRTYWVPDDEVEGIAARYAHLRVPLPWLDDEAPAPSRPATTSSEAVTVLDDMSLSLDDLESVEPEPVPAPALENLWGGP